MIDQINGIYKLIDYMFNILWYVFLFGLIFFLIYLIRFRTKKKGYIEDISKINEDEKFDLWTGTLRDLQPLAFFISTSLILAGFLKSEDTKSSGYALFSALLFMGAYFEFAQYRNKKNSLNFYTGVILIFIAIGSLINSFGGLSTIISNIGNENYFIRSILLIAFIYLIRINISQLAKLPKTIIYDIRFYLTSIILVVILAIIIMVFLGYFRENELVSLIALILFFILFFILLAYNDLYFFIRNTKKVVQDIASAVQNLVDKLKRTKN